mgnify:CR=1 FL=1
MIRHILISEDQIVSARWKEAFPAGTVAGSIAVAQTLLAEQVIVWLHVPSVAAKAITTPADVIELLSPARLIVLSDVPSDEQALDLMDCGAVGYCHSCAGAKMLHQVAAVVENRGLWVGESLLRRMIRASQTAQLPAAPEPELLTRLSIREREVALAAANGASNKEIARELKITERTVKVHLGAVFAKLDVRDRLHLAILLRRIF